MRDAREQHLIKVRQNRTEAIEEIALMLEGGASPTEVARRTGRSVAAIEIMCRRAGRRDLSRIFDRASAQIRRASRR